MEFRHDKYRMTAAAVTLLAAIAIVWLLNIFSLRYNPENRPEWPPKNEAELLMPDEYIEIEELPVTGNTGDDLPGEPSDIQSPTPEVAPPASGAHVEDAGPVSDEAPAVTTSTRPSPAKTQPRQPKDPGQLAEEKAKKDAEARKKRTEDSLYAAVNSRTKADKWNSDKNTSRTSADNSHGAGHNTRGDATGRNGVRPGKSGSGAGRIGAVGAPTGLTNLANGSYVVYLITLPENQTGKITADMVRESSSRGLSGDAGRTAKDACLRQIIGMPFKAAEGREVSVKFTFTK